MRYCFFWRGHFPLLNTRSCLSMVIIWSGIIRSVISLSNDHNQETGWAHLGSLAAKMLCVFQYKNRTPILAKEQRGQSRCYQLEGDDWAKQGVFGVFSAN
jgi:hypothetical protein